ncbi:MAG: 3'-5' exonuclease [Labilithrix sp.]|nr:3'-5' exonuclease [Labilithrix sp.]MCW5810052.1 3'-5' exonuclease [Labilithrix sp.]
MSAKNAPPPGPPWDLPLAEAPLAFVDLEMTGLDPKRDRVLEVCIERVVGEAVVDRMHEIVRPDGGESGNVHIHGIAAEEIARAPTWRELADRVAALLGGAVLVAHGAWWDVAFLRAEMERAAHRFTIEHYLDTLNLSRRAFGLDKHSLDALRAHFGIDAGRAHRADADVRALREVFARCCAALDPSTPRDLWQVRIAEKQVREHVLAQCKEALDAKRECTVVYRARARPAEPLRMMITAIDLGLDPPRVIGYQLPGRGRRELRADRILRIE